MHTVKQASEILNLSQHTIRYYCDEGLVPSLRRDSNNHRVFDEESIEWLKGTKYLRELGMPLDDIKEFIVLCQKEGKDARKKRYEIISQQLENAKLELEKAKMRISYLEKAVANAQDILEDKSQDAKNPAKRNSEKDGQSKVDVPNT